MSSIESVTHYFRLLLFARRMVHLICVIAIALSSIGVSEQENVHPRSTIRSYCQMNHVHSNNIIIINAKKNRRFEIT